MVTKGSCLCGEVHFAIEGEFENFYLCHCRYCQKDTGSGHAANLFSSKAKLKWLSGQGIVRDFNLPSTRHVKSFCSNCGSALPNVQMGGSVIVVPAGSLDDCAGIKPEAHIYVASKASWDEDLENLVKLDGPPG